LFGSINCELRGLNSCDRSHCNSLHPSASDRANNALECNPLTTRASSRASTDFSRPCSLRSDPNLQWLCEVVASQRSHSCETTYIHTDLLPPPSTFTSPLHLICPRAVLTSEACRLTIKSIQPHTASRRRRLPHTHRVPYPTHPFHHPPTQTRPSPPSSMAAPAPVEPRVGDHFPRRPKQCGSQADKFFACFSVKGEQPEGGVSARVLMWWWWRRRRRRVWCADRITWSGGYRWTDALIDRSNRSIGRFLTCIG
jgi:hypothetical protein